MSLIVLAGAVGILLGCPKIDDCHVICNVGHLL